MKKKLVSGFESYGFIGEQTGFRGLRVGDIIAFYDYKDRLQHGVVVKDSGRNRYTLMGWFANEISTLVSKTKPITKVFEAKSVTADMINKLICSEDYFDIKEVHPIKMTQAEIEKRLGFEIEIV